MATPEEWAGARKKFETTGVSGAKIASELGVSGAALSKMAKRHGWVKYSANGVKVNLVGVKVKAEKVKRPVVNTEPRLTATGKKADSRTLVAGVGKGGNQNGVMYSPEIAAKIAQRLKDGESLNSICKDEGYPSEATVREWDERDHDGFGSIYAESRRIGYARLSEEIMEISDQPPPRLDNGATDSGAVQDKRLRVDTRKWLLSKVLPKIYGDNKHVEVTGTVTQVTDRAALIEELRSLSSKGLRLSGPGDVTDIEAK